MKKIIGLMMVLIIGVGIFMMQSQESLLDKFQLSNLSLKELVKYFEYGEGSDSGLDVSITSNHLILMDGSKEQKVSLKEEDFYLSIAPYVFNTHPCDNHIPTGCQGEMSLVEFEVKAVGTDGVVYYDDRIVSADNGFFGLWLPRDKEITLYVSGLSGTSEVTINTNNGSPTCLTTMQLT